MLHSWLRNHHKPQQYYKWHDTTGKILLFYKTEYPFYRKYIDLHGHSQEKMTAVRHSGLASINV
jgi:hypothetical protein